MGNILVLTSDRNNDTISTVWKESYISGCHIVDDVYKISRILQGEIETCHIPAINKLDVSVYCNKDGKQSGLLPSASINDQWIYGPLVFVGFNRQTGDFVSMTPDVKQQIQALFRNVFITYEDDLFYGPALS